MLCFFFFFNRAVHFFSENGNTSRASQKKSLFFFLVRIRIKSELIQRSTCAKGRRRKNSTHCISV